MKIKEFRSFSPRFAPREGILAPMADGDDRLESWKEIAAFLGREVRTVQLWEKSEGLPIHRHQHARQGSIYAFKSELHIWRSARKSSPPTPTPPEQRRTPVWITSAVVLALAAGGFGYWRVRSSIATPSSIAVLPFLDLSAQKDSEYFSDGLTEEIIDALSRVPNLRVVARTSSFAFKGKNADIREIGRQLNVNAVIEGSVRKSGEALRVTAQLNRVQDGYHIWSRTYNGQLRDIFTLQRQISEAIASEVRAGKAPHPPRGEPTKDMEAYRLYQEGRYFFNRFEPPESNLKAIAKYQAAFARDSLFAEAYAGIADAYSYLAENYVRAPREVMPKAKEAAEKALALDESSAEAHTSLGIVKLDYERDIEGGQREFMRAMELKPGFGWARHWYAHSLEAQNRMEDALHEMQAALDLDPLSIPINWDIAGELIVLRRYDEAFHLLDQAKDLFPGVSIFDEIRVVGNWRRGNANGARSVIESLKKQPDAARDTSILSLFGTEEAREGDTAEARKVAAQLDGMRKTQYVDPWMFVGIYKALNDREQLVRWMRRADEERSSFFIYRRPYASFWGLDDTDLAESKKARAGG